MAVGGVVGWLVGRGVVAALSALVMADGGTAVAVAKETLSVAVSGGGEASAGGGAVVTVGLIVASAGGVAGETAVSGSGSQATSESKRKKQMRIACLMNRYDRI
jgi:hypothetical protein